MNPALHPAVGRAAGLLLAMLLACGGGAPGRTASAPAALEPVDIAVRATRVGDSVRLDITGEGRRRPEGHAMEDPDNWSILAMAGGRTLQRMVNGSVRVSRDPVGRASSRLWDVTVAFSVAFAVPAEASQITVRIRVPGSEPFEATVPVEPLGVNRAKQAHGPAD